VTPMHEADLRVHLAKQGWDGVRSIPFTTVARGDQALERSAMATADSGAAGLLFDVVDATQLATIGRVLWGRAQQATLLAVGPSSVVDGLAAAMPLRERVAAPAGFEPARLAAADGPVLVLAGSLSPVTARQVAAASSFETIALDATALASRDAVALTLHADEIVRGLARGRNVLACTRDPVTTSTPSQARIEARTQAPATSTLDAQALAHAGGDLLAAVLARVPLRRIGVAGGDTSSHGVQALAAWGLSYVADLGAGASLCRVHSDDAALDGMEIMLKGGQMGTEDVFERLVHGDTPIAR
jgi:3-oxoisoapionate kinase